MKHGKRDGNHAEIRDRLRKVPGCRVFDTGDVGGGFPDLVVGFMGRIMLLEIKDGSLPPSKRKLRTQTTLLCATCKTRGANDGPPTGHHRWFREKMRREG